MTYEDVKPWIPVIVALVVAFPGLLAYINQRRKMPAEEADLYTDAAKKLIDSLAGRLDTVTKRMDDVETLLRTARAEVEAARAELAKSQVRIADVEHAGVRLRLAITTALAGIKALTAQLKAANMTPCWTPGDPVFAEFDVPLKRE
jgi:chromosome segregation ATPase